MKIQIYDTTLRDGTQSESVSFSVEDKLRVARKLDELGIDYIEGGWPGSNEKDAEFFQRAASMAWRSARLVMPKGILRSSHTSLHDFVPATYRS